VLVEQMPIEERDFTGGTATELWLELRAIARSVESSVDAVADVVSRR
jgi:hypothetical protein